MNAPVRIAIVGAGAIARAYEAAIAQIEEARITAVCDVRRDSAAEFAGRTGCEFYTSTDELAECGAFDVAVVCTPPVSHEAVACALLASGADVLCEKPLAVDPSSAQRMLDAARSNGRLLTMASKFRFARDVRRAQEIAAGGEIGELVMVENAFTTRVDMRERWNGDPSISGGGVLMDNGTHAVDVLRAFMGPLSHVQVVEGRRYQKLPVEDTVRLFARNGDGVMGTCDLSWSIDKSLQSFLRLYGTDGTIVVGWRQSKYFSHKTGEWVLFGEGYDKIQAFRDQLINFFGATRGENELVVSPIDALASVDVIHAAYSAMEHSGWLAVSEVPFLREPALQVS